MRFDNTNKNQICNNNTNSLSTTYNHIHNKIKPNKTLGQNFLHNRIILKKISQYVTITDKSVIEIGAGTGNLTEYILQHKPRELTLYEIDDRCIKYLNNIYENNNTIKILQHNCLQNVLNTDVIIGNLPYNISSLFFYKLLLQDQYQHGVFLVQKEFAHRLLTCNNRMGWLCYFSSDITKGLIVKPGNFHPSPSVMSRVIILHSNIKINNLLHMNTLLQKLFKYPRKILRNQLDSTYSKYNELRLLRPGTLTKEQIIHLYEYELSTMKKNYI